MKKLYYSKITQDYWTDKNNLHKEIREAARSMERRLVNEDELTAFKNELHDKIAVCHANNPRCKEMKLDTYSYPKEDLHFSVSGVFDMMLYLVKPTE